MPFTLLNHAITVMDFLLLDFCPNRNRGFDVEEVLAKRRICFWILKMGFFGDRFIEFKQ